jgi:hypothetical protein
MRRLARDYGFNWKTIKGTTCDKMIHVFGKLPFEGGEKTLIIYREPRQVRVKKSRILQLAREARITRPHNRMRNYDLGGMMTRTMQVDPVAANDLAPDRLVRRRVVGGRVGTTVAPRPEPAPIFNTHAQEVQEQARVLFHQQADLQAVALQEIIARIQRRQNAIRWTDEEG